ncbi:hypothetical protein K435DRAFT_842574 [Dendrothele bispora CBS 962.96]|uniref:GST N-terminal domain-containing protein n=1 Tax=Dendrothele bispora (strain CBS 962.96) TaxID=1314807 RepID=A0A4S8LEG0_DENBC|nr:hypothetical protein K435DRAFT_842574 [Dendrothele bispora CBS 962.96]
MSDENTLIFYDIPSKIGAWSPNTWKTRYSLNFKGIPYKTVWVEYPDIEKTLKDLGIAASATKSDGKTPHYTLPAIYDPATKTGLTESFAIAKYLDEKYPDKPILVPKGTEVLQKAYIDATRDKFVEVVRQFTIPKVAWSLNERSQEFFRRTRKQRLGKTIEELDPQGEKRKEEWKKLEEGLGQIDKWYASGKEDILVMGGEDKACFADFAFAGFVIWIRILFGKESEEWKDVSGWHSERWGRMIQVLEKYE